MKIRFGYLPLLLLGACSGCSSPSGANQETTEQVMMSPPPPEAPTAPVSADRDAPNAEELAQPGAVPATTRKLIYHATVRVKVASVVRANARMDSLTRAYSAYVSDAVEKREDGQWENQMTIRVLPSRFHAMLGRLNGLGMLESKTLGTDDVTAEHADVAARLSTKRALEQRYVALLGQAKKVSDILEIEEKIGGVRGDIEATESRLKTLNDQVAYSTITLTYFQPLPLSTPDAPVLSFGSRLVHSFYSGWELCTDLVLALVSLWPLLLAGSVAVWAVRAWRRRKPKPA